MKSFLRRMFLACSLLTAVASTLLAAEQKPIFLYSRRFNAPGENRYLPDGNFKDLLQRLAKDFDVHATGNQVQIDPSNPANPRALVTNNLAIKPAKGPRDEAGVLLAIANPGKGHVAVVTDSGWVADFAFDETGVGGVSLKGQDNWEIFHRLTRWSAGLPAAP